MYSRNSTGADAADAVWNSNSSVVNENRPCRLVMQDDGETCTVASRSTLLMPLTCMVQGGLKQSIDMIMLQGTLSSMTKLIKYCGQHTRRA